MGLGLLCLLVSVVWLVDFCLVYFWFSLLFGHCVLLDLDIGVLMVFDLWAFVDNVWGFS